MAVDFNVQVLFDRFPEIITKLSTGADEAVKATADEISAQASARAPKLTGALASSIGTTSSGGSQATVSADIRYAGYVEFGTAKHGGPQPYLIPAAHAEEPAFMEKIQALVQ